MTVAATIQCVSPAYSLGFATWQGNLHLPSSIVDNYARVGQDGSGVQLLGRRGPPCKVRGIAVWTSVAAANLFRVQLELVKGNVITVSDPLGLRWSPCFLLDALCEVRAARGIFAGATFTHITDCQMLIEVQP